MASESTPNFVADPTWHYYQHYHACIRAQKFIEKTMAMMQTAEVKTFDVDSDCDRYLTEARAAIDCVDFEIEEADL